METSFYDRPPVLVSAFGPEDRSTVQEEQVKIKSWKGIFAFFS